MEKHSGRHTPCIKPGCPRPALVLEPVALCRKHAAEVYHALYRINGHHLYPPEMTEQLATADERRAKRAAARKAALEEQSVVYYIRMKNDLIKIGYTTNLVARCVALRVRTEDVLVTEPGGPEKERERHVQFAHLRHGRWEEFDPADELLGHMARLHREHGDPVITTYPKVHSE